MTSPSTATAVTALAPGTLQSWFKEHQDLVVIDVRSAAEFESMHIRGSYNVPLPLLSEHTDELAARLGSRVVLVCQSGVRAEQARQRLGGAGIGTAYVLTGGVPGFAAMPWNKAAKEPTRESAILQFPVGPAVEAEAKAS